MIKSVLITKELFEVPLLEKFCAKNKMDLIANSFIRFSLVQAEIPVNIEAVFFGSKRAVEFFLLQSDLPVSCKVACIGETTKNYIENLGIEVDFCGSKAGDPEFVAQELKEWLGKRKLHIALSDQSNRSMSKLLPEYQVDEFIVYQTISDPKPMPDAPDLIIFTSPSNLNGFLVENQISSRSKVIAWGKTTEKALNAVNIHPDLVLQQATESELIEILQKGFINHP